MSGPDRDVTVDEAPGGASVTHRGSRFDERSDAASADRGASSEAAAEGLEPGAGGVDATVAGWFDRSASSGIASAVAIPVLATAFALVVGAVLIAWIGSDPVSVYADVVDGVVRAPRGFSDTATTATPVLLIALGYAFAYRARVFTIGAEGQYLLGAVAAVGAVTAPGVRDLPAAVLVLLGLVVGALAGAAWSALSGVLHVRFGASIVISSLMLVYIAQATLQWANRVGIRDPDSFVPASRQVGGAALPEIPWIDTHAGFAIALAVVPVMAWVLARHRLGYRVRALGDNAEALDANEVSANRVVVIVLVVSGALAGLAGFVEIAGVNGRLNDSASLGYGFTAIVVALVGRLHPVGVLVAALALAALDIGFEVAARSSDLPTSMAGLVQVLVVVFVVAGDAVHERWSAT
ncbi:ABC transporter permease [Ilumatobacter sp.]|uniref:ABC transporter permease n=1 Tax=Ilumatobacter sp. TaxID=1967498 RepID=UPI003B529F84